MTDHEKQICIQFDTDSTRDAVASMKAHFKSDALRYLRELESLVDEPSRFMRRVGWMTANLSSLAFRAEYGEGHLDGIGFVTGLDKD